MSVEKPKGAALLGGANPRAVIGSNSGNTSDVGGIDMTPALAQALQNLKSKYNRAALDKRHANEKIRDQKRDFKAANPDVYDAIESIRKSAIEKMHAKLAEKPEYTAAVNDRRNAADRMKEVVKLAKEHGIDMQAFKIVMKMADLDEVERAEFFDAVDMYATGLRLWGESYGKA